MEGLHSTSVELLKTWEGGGGEEGGLRDSVGHEEHTSESSSSTGVSACPGAPVTELLEENATFCLVLDQ